MNWPRPLQRPRSSDVVLPALFGVVGSVEMAVQGYGPLWASIGTFWLASLALCARRAFPLVMPPLVVVASAAGALVGVAIDEPASWILPIALACVSAGLYPRRMVPGLASVAASLVLTMVELGALTDVGPDLLFGVVFMVGPWALGRALGVALARNRELAAEAERARLGKEMAAAAAAAAERERIARELHDVLAHSLSVMVVQATLAEDLLRRDPDGSTTALRQVQRSGREALGETAHLLRLIRDDRDELGMRPQRRLADLPELADEYARAGLAVDLRVEPAADSVPLGLELSAYRIVQEALTNALKHAPGSPVTVSLGRRGVDLEIQVRNGPGRASPVTDVPSGQGLVGIRERVAVFGGTLRAAPTGDGGFELSATLPAAADTP
jgi:signal transduction histidine kinase